MLIFPLFAALLIASTEASFQNRIRIESSKIFIKYEHQMNGKNAGFHQTVNTSLFNNTQIFDCSKDAFTFCLKWGEIGQFKITVDDKCEDYEFSSKLEGSLRIRFDISNVHIYGGFEQDFQKWPMDYDEYEEYPFVSTDRYTKGVLEPYWLVSNGLYLYVDEKTPLFITQNKGKGVLELIAEKKAPYIRNGDTILKYRVCKFDDMKQAHMHAVANILGKPNGIPDRKMVQYPIWSTWAKYKMNISESIVIQFANLIKQYALPNSQLELDDRWETCYGSTEIDTSTFPDMKSLVSRLKSMGFRVTMWMHPFINTICEPHHTQALQQGYLVKSAAGETVIEWWNGKGSVIDFTNPKAVAWFSQKVKKIQDETGIDSFKFDAGESAYSPQVPIFHRMAEDHPETHLKAYVKAVSAFGDMVEVRSSRRTQTLPIFVRMMDRDTNWDKRLGLSTLIPTLLQMNIIGYPFVLPDMVGGNGYDDASVTKEMFVRWLQINVFMPSLQFSYPPWDFDNEVLDLTRKFINLHAKYTDKIIEAMIQAKEKGTPVNPPIWWIDPTDPVAQNIGTEFLLGEDILVAPVIEQGAQSRDIYLPRGIWRDETNNETELIKGPIWLYNYPANLHTLPYFTKIRDIDESKNSASNVPTSGNLIICATVVFLVTIFNQL